MTAPLGFAIVGCGMVARFHIRALAEVPGAKLTALVGRSLEAPNRLASEMSLTDVGVYSNLDDALRRPDVDAVIICTPSGNHLPPAMQAAQAGKHVVVEKPLEITPERCDQIIDACDRAGVRLGTIFPSRFADANVALKAAVGAGRFGRLVLGETTCKWWRSQEYYDSGDWRGTWALDGGGALLNQAIHNVDMLMWLMGPATQVTAATATLAHERIEVEDTAVATVHFANGALGTIIAATSAYPGLAKTIALHGDRGSAVIAQDVVSVWQFADERPEDAVIRSCITSSNTGASDPKAISHEGHARQLSDFVEAVRTGRNPAIDGREGRKAVQLICAIYEASRTGRSVEV